MLKTFIVEYTNEELVGNHIMTFEVDAEDIDECYDIIDDMYAHVAVDNVYLKGTGYVV